MRVFLKSDMILLNSFLHQVLSPSVLIALSRMAIQVRKAPMGARTRAEMKSPSAAEVAPSRASLVPEMSTTQYRTKNRMDRTAGVPSPPFRIREPIGAPMKNSRKQARAWAYFFQISTSVQRRRSVDDTSDAASAMVKVCAASLPRDSGCGWSASQKGGLQRHQKCP